MNRKPPFGSLALGVAIVVAGLVTVFVGLPRSALAIHQSFGSL